MTKEVLAGELLHQLVFPAVSNFNDLTTEEWRRIERAGSHEGFENRFKTRLVQSVDDLEHSLIIRDSPISADIWQRARIGRERVERLRGFASRFEEREDGILVCLVDKMCDADNPAHRAKLEEARRIVNFEGIATEIYSREIEGIG